MQTQLRDVEYFAAIAAHGQVQRAAAALGLSQPALSKSLRRLEQSMNAKLLMRTPKGVELTRVGTTLLAHFAKLRLSLDDVLREISDLSEGRTGHLRIGMAAVLAHVVPKVWTALLKEAPRSTLHLSLSPHNQLVTALRKNTLDIAVSATSDSYQDDLVEEHLYDEVSAVYASANHPLAKRKKISLTELAAEQWALSSLDRGAGRLLSEAFANAGLPPPKRIVESASEMAKFHLAAASNLLVYGSKPVAQYAAGHLGIVELPVTGIPGNRRVCVTYRKDAYLPPVAFRFIDMLKKAAADMQKKTP